MFDVLGSARASLVTGVVTCAAILLLWLLASTVDGLGLVSFLVRWVHVISSMIWIGMIWFVNFIQFAALEAADDGGRAALMKLVVPRVAWTFRHVSHVTVVSGLVLLMTTGYLFDRWVFSSAVYVPPLKFILLWGGSLAGVAMWVIVHAVLWPNLRIVMGETFDEKAKAQARAKVRTYVRLNLLLGIPVTFVMVAAAHLY